MIQMHDIASRSSPIDGATSRAVCDGVGERLRDSLHREPPSSIEIASLLKRLEQQDWERPSK